MKKTFLKFTSLFCAVLVGFTCLTNSYRKAKALVEVGITILAELAVWGIEQAVTGICGLINTAYENSLPITKEEHYAGLNMLVEFFKDNNKFNPDDPNFLKTVEFLNLETKDDLKAYLEQQYIEYSGGEIDINSLGEFYNSYLVPTFGENAVQNWDTFHLLVWSICNHSEIKGYTPQKIVDYVKRNYKDSGVGITDNGTPTFSAEAFANEVIETLNKYIDPKNPHMLKFSYTELSQSQQNPSNMYYARNIFQDNVTIFGTPRADGVYIQAYVQDKDGVFWYCPYSFRLYEKEEWTQYQYQASYCTYTWYADYSYFQQDNGVSLDDFTTPVFNYVDTYTSDDVLKYKSAYQPFINLGFSSTDIYFKGYSSKLSAMNNLVENNTFNSKSNSIQLNSGVCFQGNTDNVSSAYRSSNVSYFLRSYDTFKSKDRSDTMIAKNSIDYGLYISDSPFSTTYLIDTTKIPSNTTVTMSGDTVYDYSITDNSTGDSTTIGEYVENNYTFNGDINQGGSGGTGGSGGSVNGNITVGGQVDVGGSVDVNVDVNINGNVGGVAGGVGGDNYSLPDTGAVDEYLQNAVDESSGFRKYLEQFFSFLPPPILVLLGLAISAALIARLCGR